MKHNFILSFYLGFFLSVPLFSSAQYFYKDLWNNQQLQKEFVILRNENITSIMVKSFEDDGQPSEGFFCEKRIDKNYTRSEMSSRSYISGESLLLSFYNLKGQIIKTIDSTGTSSTHSLYVYDDRARIKSVSNSSLAQDDSLGGVTEIRQYYYSENGKLLKMTRQKNGTEVSVVTFVSDEKGNVTEEHEVLPGNIGKRYYYYYDDKNRLTDVVHFNEQAKRLLPDYMYEYNALGQVRQMINTEEGGSNYFIWRYTYNDQRLRDTETCLSKEKRVLGTISYKYK